MMQTCYPSLQVYYTKFALKSQSNFEDSKKTIPICKNSWVLGFLVQEWAISHIYRYAIKQELLQKVQNVAERKSSLDNFEL